MTRRAKVLRRAICLSRRFARRRLFPCLCLFVACAAGAANPIALTPVGFGASAFPAGDHVKFNAAYLPFRAKGGEFSYGETLVSSPGAAKPYSYQFESQYGAFAGSTPTLRLTSTAAGASLAGLGHNASVTEIYSFSVDSIQPLPAGATRVPVELPVRVSLLATRLPPGPPDLNTVAKISATIARSDSTGPAIHYLLNTAACLNVSFPICASNSFTFEQVLTFDVNPNIENKLTMVLGSDVRPEADGSFDGYVHGSIDPLPRLSMGADPEAYGLPAGARFSDYFALRFSPNLYTVAQLPVPEPSSGMLWMLGLSAVALSLHRRSVAGERRRRRRHVR